MLLFSLSRKRGFTLIEMVIVVTLITILAALAVSSYRSTYVKSHRAAAKQFMIEIANRQEQYFLDARAYTETVGTGGLGLSVPNEVSPYYTISLKTETTPPSFSITATAQDSQLDDGDLVMNSDGSKTPVDKW